MWPLIRNTLLRFILSILDPDFKAELDAFEQIKAAKQREREALQLEIAELDNQIKEAEVRRMDAIGEIVIHLAEVENTEALIQKVKDEKQTTSNIDDASALRDQL